MSTKEEVKLSTEKLDSLCINTIRFLSVDAVQKANSGHPGLPLDAAPMAYVLWTHYLKHNPRNPGWFDRDRFVLSAGHGSMLLYSLLYLTGYDMPLEQIKQFRQWESITPGHPESHLTPGVETTTGPLGQGFGNGVGMALVEAHLAAHFNRPGYEVIDHYTYGLVSDGDLMEGIASEAASLAGHWKLGKLIYIYDSNHMSLAASTNITFTEDVAERFRAYHWHVQYIEDGNDVDSIDKALANAREVKDKPSLIIVRTHLGYGSPNKQDTFEAHGSPLGPEEVKLTKENLGWPEEPDFLVPEEALDHMRKAVERGKKSEEAWQHMFLDYKKEYPELAAMLEKMMRGELAQGWNTGLPHFDADPKGMSTRVASGKVMSVLASKVPNLIGGSADLNPSTHTALEGQGDFENPERAGGDMQGSTGGGWSYAGRNLHFGVREHAMGSILNGMAAHGGVIPYGATFLIFSDYMRPPMRLAALMEKHVVYVFTHDSIGLGEDGPTHQPVEQLVGLRAIPRMLVIRPADANEVTVAWQVAVEQKDRPVSLVFSRQNLPVLDRKSLASSEGLRQGGYILAEASGGKPDVILIATGSEVSLVLEARTVLEGKGIKTRVVSMPCWKLFDMQDENYRHEVLPGESLHRLAVEAGSPVGWERYTGIAGDVIGVTTFGASAPGKTVMKNYGFNVDNVVEHAVALVEKGTQKR